MVWIFIYNLTFPKGKWWFAILKEENVSFFIFFECFNQRTYYHLSCCNSRSILMDNMNLNKTLALLYVCVCVCVWSCHICWMEIRWIFLMLVLHVKNIFLTTFYSLYFNHQLHITLRKIWKVLWLNSNFTLIVPSRIRTPDLPSARRRPYQCGHNSCINLSINGNQSCGTIAKQERGW